ncbi:MAG: hypothetical protein H6R05_927, partial [Burkholderiaceae bacterium]|nr:hypothetical protein [Burkholderiaceae bacterium]
DGLEILGCNNNRCSNRDFAQSTLQLAGQMKGGEK